MRFCSATERGARNVLAASFVSVAVGTQKLQIVRPKVTQTVAIVGAVDQRDDVVKMQPLCAAPFTFHAAFAARITAFARQRLLRVVRPRAKAVVVPAIRLAVLSIVPMSRAAIFAIRNAPAAQAAFAGDVVQRREAVRGALDILALRSSTPIAPATRPAAAVSGWHGRYFHAGTRSADGI